MKKTILFLLILIIFTGLGCREEETKNTFSTTDCPEPEEGWEYKETSRYEFEPNATSTEWPQLFTHDDNWGLRCLYYEPEGEEFDITHTEGKSYGNWQYHYEMEIRKFTHSEPKNYYNEKVVTELLNTYCLQDKQVVMPLHLKEGASNDRYQCHWPINYNGDTPDQISTNTLISITDYKDSLITLAITREMGKTHFIPPNYSGTQEEQKNRGIRAQELVYNSFEFIHIPEKHEENLIKQAINLIDSL